MQFVLFDKLFNKCNSFEFNKFLLPVDPLSVKIEFRSCPEGVVRCIVSSAAEGPELLLYKFKFNFLLFATEVSTGDGGVG